MERLCNVIDLNFSFQGRLLASRTLRARLPMSWNYRERRNQSEKEEERHLSWSGRTRHARWHCDVDQHQHHLLPVCDPLNHGQEEESGGDDDGLGICGDSSDIAYTRLFLIRVMIPMWLNAESLETVVRLLSLLFITPQQNWSKLRDSIALGAA